MPTRKTIVVPCSVKSRLKTCGETRVLPAWASCQRMTAASRPAIRKNPRPATTYMTPSRLWSTVTTQSCALIAGVASLEGHEVGDEPVQLRAGDLHRGHQRAGLERVGIADPGPEILAGVQRHARAQRRAAHEMGEVGAEDA